MHITDLHIDRFGIWQDLTLPLSGPGLNVLYGPNEAGKSTLMRFVTGVLYGSVPPRTEVEPPPLHHDRHQHGRFDEPFVAGGSLRVLHDGRPYTIRRSLTAAGDGHAHIVGPHESPVPEGWLEELLGSTSRDVFDRVFSVDLYELQELATLDHEELAEHIYGLSLGRRGKRLMAAVDDLRRQRETLLSADGRSGRAARLLDRERSLLARLGELPDLPAVHANASGQRDTLDGDITALRRRRQDLQHELRGRRFMERVWSPWKQVREYTNELHRLAAVPELPADGLEQLDGIERGIDAHTHRRDDRLTDVADRERRAAALGPEPEIVRYEPAVRAMLGLRDWLKETTAARGAAATARNHAHVYARETTAKIAPDWTDEQLAQVDTSPQAQLLLMDAARAYRTAIRRRSAVRRSYKRLQKATTKREAAVQEALAALEGRTPEEIAAASRDRMSDLERLAELRAKEVAYEHRSVNLRKRLEHLTESLEVPPWVSFVLAVFAIGGACFAIAGLFTGVTTSALAGTIYLLLGLTCGSLTVKLRQHFDAALRETTERVRDERRSEEVELRKVREEIARLTGTVTNRHRPHPSVQAAAHLRHETATRSIVEPLHAELRQLHDLASLERRQENIRKRRRLLTTVRGRLRRVQQGLETARHEWCRTLTDVGLAESLDIDSALTGWQQLAEAVAARSAVAPIEREHALLDASLRSVGTQIDGMGKRMGAKHGDPHRPLDLLAAWESELTAAAVKAKERTRLHDEQRRAQAQADEADAKRNDLVRQRAARLAAAGVASRVEYAKRLKLAEDRAELQGLLAMARADLEDAAATDQELAIVEEDLEAFRPDANAAALARLARDGQQIDAELEAALERRGQIVRHLSDLESDGSSASLRHDRGRIDSQLRRTAERLLAVALAERAAERARAGFERDHQPPVLAAASETLAQLTRGRYVRVWAPPGERTLRVDDQHGRTLAVDQLSGGTREQLFLAVRMGLVRHAAQRGVHLPLILDDVLVNFDQHRTEAALETLREFAAEGRQVLFFTCHLHLAQSAEAHGNEPIWLPGHHSPAPQRLAG